MGFERKHLVRGTVAAALAGVLLGMSWWSGELRARSTDAEMRENLLRQTADIAAAVNPGLVKKLTFTTADKNTSAFKQLQTVFTTAGRSFPQRGIYTIALRDGTLLFGPENYAESDPMASPPGTVYRQPPAGFLSVFRDKRPAVVGVYADEYGTFVSSAAPVLDPGRGTY